MGLLDDAIKEHLELKRRRGADAGEISRLESEALGPVPRSTEGVPDMSGTFEPPREESAAGGAAAAGDAASPPASRPWEDEGAALHGAPPPAADPTSPPPFVEPPPGTPPMSATPPAAAPAPASSAPVHEPPPVAPTPPERDPWTTDDPGPDPDPTPPQPEPEAESGGLFSRLRGGRRAKHERESEPPPAAPDPALAAYEPPPVPGPAYDAAPPPVEHEPDIVPADDEPDGEDLLEETPEFLEETPEHDRLWFEQRPPRDFNFDD